MQLDAAGSTDPDAGPEALSYFWQQTAGPSVGTVMPSAVNPSVTLAEAGTYTFSATVSDGHRSDSDDVTVLAKIAGQDLLIVGNSANLTNAEQAISTRMEGYGWTVDSSRCE